MVFRLDLCGILCLFFTYLIVLYADYVVIFCLIRPVLKNSISAILNTVAFNLIAFLLSLCHLSAVFCDPGLISLTQFPLKFNGLAAEKPVGWSACTRCSIFRPPRAHHCRICGRCVRRMDHHCPWINNCVGEYNQKYFVLFLCYVGILCIYALILIVVCRAVVSTEETASHPDTLIVAHTVILVAICCLFGLFVLAVLSDQYKSIVEDETPIEALQARTNRIRDPTTNINVDVEANHVHRRRLSKRQLFREIFGDGPVYLWFLPCHHLFKPGPCNDPVILMRHTPHQQPQRTQLPQVQVLTDSPPDSDSSTDFSSF